MITCKTIGYNGRLGNQMFQYAAGYALAKRLNTEFVVPEENTNQEIIDGGGNLSKCYLYEIFPHITSPTRPMKLLSTSRSIVQMGFNLDNRVFGCTDNTDISGYFQSDKWFSDVSDEIRKEFELSTTNPPKGGFLHVRRGDYCTKSDYHPHSDMDYYNKALSVFDGIDFQVFSDDLDWCRNQFKGSRFEFVEANETETMTLMSSSEYAIIANSSFSWWGAWLGKCNTIAPKKWFGPRFGDDWNDIYCDGWEIV